ncbi:hypothetical protein [Nocardia sp. NPDC049149]|uniref:hypothetical protein n=1 Tax=Nocardia sp. NPDC049149 TaxID=3364315 RepID=UPI0037116D98
MSTPHDPKSTGGAPEPADAESAASSGASLRKEPAAPPSDAGAAPSLSKDGGAAEPSSQPATPSPAQAGAWWEPTDAPPGPLGGEAQPWDSGSAAGNQPGGHPASGQQQWGTPQPAPPSGQQWGAQQQSPYPPFPGGNQPQDATPPQYPQGGIYNYPGYGEQQNPPPGQYGVYPQQPYQPYVNPPHPSGSQVYSIIGFVCGMIAILFCPILFGPAGIILGVIGHRKGEPLGKWAAIIAAVCMVLGLIVGFLIFNGDLTT